MFCIGFRVSYKFCSADEDLKCDGVKMESVSVELCPISSGSWFPLYTCDGGRWGWGVSNAEFSCGLSAIMWGLLAMGHESYSKVR